MIQLKQMIDGIKVGSRQPKMKKEFFEAVDELRPFIFLSDPKNPNTEGMQLPHREMDEIDLPFEVCSFEDENWRKRIIMKGRKADMSDSRSIAISCIVIKELAPKQYKLWVYDGSEDNIIVLTQDSGLPYNQILQFVQERFINRLSTDEIGTSKSKERIKYKLDGKKRVRVIKKVVYVSKGLIKESVHGQTVNWDYSHRWEVRGHWRKLNEGKLGKNRNGDYAVKGYTWVVAHEKGPEDKPLVKKTRVG